MNELFIRLYLDEDVSVIVASLLRSRGFSVTTTVQTGQLGRTDAEQLAFAIRNNFAIVTHNRADFERLANDYRDAAQRHAGMIIAVRRRESELASRLLRILDQVTADEMENQVFYI